MNKHLRRTTRCIGVGAVLSGILSPAIADASPSSPVSTPTIALTQAVDTPTILSGATVTYSMTVTNPGSSPLSGVWVTSDSCSSISFLSGDLNSDSMLNPGESWMYRCSAVVMHDTTATATVTAMATQGSTGQDLGATASKPVVTKTDKNDDNSNPDKNNDKNDKTDNKDNDKNNDKNDNKNNDKNNDKNDNKDNDKKDDKKDKDQKDQKDQKDEDEDDDEGGSGGGGTGNLNPGTPVSATASSKIDVVNPGLAIDVETLTPVVQSGGTVTYRVTIRNTGDTPLTSLGTTSIAGDCARTAGTIPADAVLDIDETVSYTCEAPAPADDSSLSVTATAHAPVGPDVTATDDASVDVIHPAVVEPEVPKQSPPAVFASTPPAYPVDTPKAEVPVVAAATPAPAVTPAPPAPTAPAPAPSAGLVEVLGVQVAAAPATSAPSLAYTGSSSTRSNGLLASGFISIGSLMLWATRRPRRG